jgi:hypothetical protein
VVCARKLKFWLQTSFEPHTQNFENPLRIWNPLKTQEQKYFEISFENFQKMLYGSNFGKRCLLEISIQIFSQIWKILFIKENLEFSLKKYQKFV